MPSSSHSETLLDEQECRALLPTRPVGRVGFTEQALPVIYPAHFVVHDDEIILAALPDGRVTNARQHAILAFEVDAYDAATRQGWCVSTLGRSRLITDTAHIHVLDALNFNPFTDRPDRHYIAIEMNMIRGKKLASVQPQP